MPNVEESPKKTIERIADFVKNSKLTGSSPVLVLGSKAGWFYRHNKLYEEVKSNGSRTVEFDGLSESEKFKECYDYLCQFQEAELDVRLEVLLPEKVETRREDKYIAELIYENFFSIVISTNFDTLLDNALLDIQIQSRLTVRRDNNWTRMWIPGKDTDDKIYNHFIGNKKTGFVKIFGDIISRHYNAPINEFNVDAEEKKVIRSFLEQALSNNILVIGYDNKWDASLDSVFRSAGGMIYYVNEEQPERRLKDVMEKRGGRSLIGEPGSFELFVSELYSEIFINGPPNPEYTRRVWDQLQTIQNKIKSMQDSINQVDKNVSSLQEALKSRRYNKYIKRRFKN